LYSIEMTTPNNTCGHGEEEGEVGEKEGGREETE
jgi:hypothetical protein